MKAPDSSQDLRQGALGESHSNGIDRGLQDFDEQPNQQSEQPNPQIHSEPPSPSKIFGGTSGGGDRAGGFTVFDLVAEQLEQAHHTLRVQHECVLQLLTQQPMSATEGRVTALSQENRSLQEQLLQMANKMTNQERSHAMIKRQMSNVDRRGKLPPLGETKESACGSLEKQELDAFGCVVASFGDVPQRPSSQGRPGGRRPPTPEGGMPSMLTDTPEEVGLGPFDDMEQLQSVCECGNLFIDDIRICQHCGAHRNSKDMKAGSSASVDRHDSGTGGYQLLAMWNARKNSFVDPGKPRKSMSLKFMEKVEALDLSGQLERTEEDDLAPVSVLYSTGICRHFVVNPNSSKRTAWEICSMFLVLHDLIMIPFGFFDPEKTSFFLFMEWVTRMFWTCDMPMSLSSGYITADGTLEMRPKKIMKRYFKTWFGLDCIVVGVDWMEILMSSVAASFGFARLGKASRVFRILRLLRLLRLAKVGEIVNLISERLPSEKLVIFIDILKLIVIMLGTGHLIACIWYAIGKAGPPEKNWLDFFGFREESLDYRYMMSLRWALSQFAGGMDEVTPKSLTEHFFGAAVYLTAFWSGTVFLSILTSHMTQLYILGNQQHQQLNIMRRYLSSNGISKGLALRVTRNAQHAMKLRQKSTPESAVGLSELVSEPLRIELHFEMYFPLLGHHTFFLDYFLHSPHVVRKICHAAMSVSSNSIGDVLFHFGEASSKMMILRQGCLRYSWGAGNEELMAPGNWISEAPLWTTWAHRGILTAIEDSAVFDIVAEEFHEIVSQFEVTTFDPCVYANQFVNKLNQLDADDVTDLPFDGWVDANPKEGLLVRARNLTQSGKRTSTLEECGVEDTGIDDEGQEEELPDSNETILVEETGTNLATGTSGSPMVIAAAHEVALPGEAILECSAQPKNTNAWALGSQTAHGQSQIAPNVTGNTEVGNTSSFSVPLQGSVIRPFGGQGTAAIVGTTPGRTLHKAPLVAVDPWIGQELTAAEKDGRPEWATWSEFDEEV